MHKLTLSSMLSSLLAVLTVLTIVVVITFNAARNDLVENLQTTASLLGASANASISLKDPAYANNALNTLVNQNHVIEAKIFTPGNQAENESSVVASYKNDLLFNQSDISPQLKFNPAKQDPLISQNEILISEPVFNGNQVIASISILASLQPLYDRLKLIVLFSLLALAMATLISFVIWRSTQQTWARPFVKFSRAIQYVIQEKDYSKRIKVTTKDDLGEMISGFNTLMTQIQAAQLKLKNQQATLEYEVEARTEELTRANRKLISEVAERSKTEINLSKLSRAVAQAEESVIITDNEGKIEYVNPSFEKITGYKKSQAIGSNASLLRSDYHDDDFYNDLWDTLARGKVYKGVFINSRPDGNEYHFEQSITPMRNQHGMITHFVATGRDISERIQNEEALQFMAHHDALTSLPNRSLLSDRIERALARAKRERTEVAIMFIDLDGFKMANDMYGHEAGDVVLKSVASRLRSTIRSQDTVARLSGDEFAVMIEDLQNVSDAGIVARKILDSLALPHEHGNEEIFVTASIGISIFPGDGKNARVLLKHADQAMYQAKFKGKARYSFYSKKINANETQRMQKEQALIRAVKEKQFVLHYQPLMHTDQK
ncbi:MAG: diguanylate cyclase, partial [Gammaproteobacteria bacterium]|nr:diguanylate cyclase [Gammaproteobacteria bacterium]